MPNVLKVQDIIKTYPGTVALKKVSGNFRCGEVHALIGKNGSGKSTLLKTIAGAVIPDSGKIFLDEKELSITSPKQALELGIATVYQEMSILPALTVGENIFLSHLPKKNGKIEWKKVYAEAQSLLDDLEIDIDAKAVVSSLSIGERQMVEIAKAMSTNPSVLQLDEPTSAITGKEVQALFKVVRRLKQKNVIIIYVSHKLHELWDIADVCTVFRDGEYIGTEYMNNLSHAELVHMMFGDVQIQTMPDDIKAGEHTVLEVKNITYSNKVHNVSFQLYEGEILGIAGMLGSGRTELLSSVFGAVKPETGEIYFEGERVKSPNPQKMKKLGMAMTTEDRQKYGLILFHSIRDNLVNASIEENGRGIFYNNKLATFLAKKQVEDLSIKIGGLNFSVSSLSGGNQQKVVVGKWLNTNPKVMMFDEPSRGIDIKAKQQIFEIIWNQARKGVSSIVVSTELEELLEVCSRILVMKDGEIIKEIKNPKEYTVEQIYSVCMGGESA